MYLLYFKWCKTVCIWCWQIWFSFNCLYPYYWLSSFIEKTESNFIYFYVNLLELILKINCIHISNQVIMSFNYFISLKIYILSFNSWVKIQSHSPDMGLKRGIEYSFDILKIHILLWTWFSRHFNKMIPSELIFGPRGISITFKIGHNMVFL